MKFTKGLFVGTALGISAAMMMNKQSTNNNSSGNNANNQSNTIPKNNTNTYESNYKSTSITTPTDLQTNDYIENDII